MWGATCRSSASNLSRAGPVEDLARGGPGCVQVILGGWVFFMSEVPL